MKTPIAIQKKAQALINSFGDCFDKIGEYNGKHVYIYVFPEGVRTGFPIVFLYDEVANNVEEITGIEAMTLLSSL